MYHVGSLFCRLFRLDQLLFDRGASYSDSTPTTLLQVTPGSYPSWIIIHPFDNRYNDVNIGNN